MKMILIVPVLCILSVGYIDADTHKKESIAQNYTAFETISDEELEAERKRVEELYKIQNDYTLRK